MERLIDNPALAAASDNRAARLRASVAAALGLYLLIALGISNELDVPWSDAAGYEAMVAHFMQTGTLDFMRWCQPTFVGLLPFAAGWSAVAGPDAWGPFGLIWGALAVALLAALCARAVGAWRGLALVLGLLAFEEFTFSAPTLMTDVPYIALLLAWLWAHDRLFGAERPAGRAWLWIGWTAAMLLAALIRPFVLMALPVLLWGAWRDRERRMAFVAASLLTLLVAAAYVVVPGLVGVNRLSSAELTVVREVFVDGDWARLNLRQFALVTLNKAALLAPVALLLGGFGRARWHDWGAGALAGAVAIYFLGRGLLPPLVDAGPLGIGPGVTGAFAVVMSIAGVAMGLPLLRSAAAGRAGGVGQVAVVLVLLPVALLPLMQHPMLRYALPVLATAILAMAHSATATAAWQRVAAAALLALLVVENVSATRWARALNAEVYREGERLVAAGVSPDEIFAEWAWFCRRHLHPGQPDAVGYVRRYADLYETAHFRVGSDPSRPQGRTLREVPVRAAGRSAVVWVVDREGTAP